MVMSFHLGFSVESLSASLVFAFKFLVLSGYWVSAGSLAVGVELKYFVDCLSALLLKPLNKFLGGQGAC
jgi:hypothetical protein